MYSNFNELYNTQKNVCVFNGVTERPTDDYNGEVDGSGYPIGCFDVTENAFGYPILSVHYYGDFDIRGHNLMREDNEGFCGITFHSSNLNGLESYGEGDDLVETLFSVICDSTDRQILDDSPSDAIDLDFPLSRTEALRMAEILDSCVDSYVKKHNIH